MQPADDVLIERSKNGDLDAFEQIVRRYENKVYNIAYRFIGNHADASDLAQEAFLRIYQALPGFRSDASLMTWIYRITSNVCRDEIRRQQRAHVIYIDSGPGENNPFNINQLTCQGPTPEEVVEQHEFNRLVQKCLNELTEEHRLILIAREMQDLSYEEIAEVLQCSLGTVKSRLSRARHAFKEKYLSYVEHFRQETRLAR